MTDIYAIELKYRINMQMLDMYYTTLPMISMMQTAMEFDDTEMQMISDTDFYYQRTIPYFFKTF